MGQDMYNEGRDSSRRESPYLRRAIEALHRKVKRALKAKDPRPPLKEIDKFLVELRDALEWKYSPSPDWQALEKLLGEKD